MREWYGEDILRRAEHVRPFMIRLKNNYCKLASSDNLVTHGRFPQTRIGRETSLKTGWYAGKLSY